MDLAQANQKRWGEMSITSHQSLFKSTAQRLGSVEAMARYKAIQAKTGVPWQVIAVIHEREASQDWKANLAQGDPWNKRSVHVPANRGPFPSFEDAAVDALVNCPPYIAHNKDWTPGGTLAALEKYNGLGYANKGIPSPYIWAGTNQYKAGKYIADGKFSATAVDQQLGCAGLLQELGMFSTPKKAGASATGAIVAIGTGAVVAGTQTQHHWGWIIGGALAAFVVAFSFYEALKGK